MKGPNNLRSCSWNLSSADVQHRWLLWQQVTELSSWEECRLAVMVTSVLSWLSV